MAVLILMSTMQSGPYSVDVTKKPDMEHRRLVVTLESEHRVVKAQRVSFSSIMKPDNSKN
jgi:hypothetical protein